MTAVILAPGPSLAGLTYTPLADVVIGVNRASVAHAVDVWACLDFSLLKEETRNVLGKPKLWTGAETWRTAEAWCGLELATTSDAMRVFFPVNTRAAWTLYTTTTALVFAAWVGAERIDVYGADMEGTKGFDAKDRGGNRSSMRWASERVIFAEVMEMLKARGVTVVRQEAN